LIRFFLFSARPVSFSVAFEASAVISVRARVAVFLTRLTARLSAFLSASSVAVSASRAAATLPSYRTRPAVAFARRTTVFLTSLALAIRQFLYRRRRVITGE
jgi:hypothetical protein